MIIKPRLWNVKPALIDPKWKWFWDHCVAAYTLEGSVYRDWITGDIIAFATTAFPLNVGELGSYIGPLDGTQSTTLRTTRADLLALPFTDFSVVSRLSATAFNANDPILSWNGTDDIVIYPFDANGPRIFWRDIGGNIIDNDASPYPADGTFATFCFASAEADHEVLYNNGLSAGASSASKSGAGPFSTVDFAHFNGGDMFANGSFYYHYFFNKRLSSFEVAELHRDPFGMFTMLDEFPIGVVAGGIISLSAVIAASAAINPAIDGRQGLNSAIAASSAVSASLDAQPGLYSAIAAVSAISAELDRQPGLNSIIIAASTVAAGLDPQSGLYSAVAAISALAADADAQPGLYSAIAATSAINSALAAEKGLDAVIAATSAYSAALDAQPGLYSVIAAVSDIIAALKGQVLLDATITGTSAILSSIDSQQALNALISVVSSISSDINIVVNIDGTILSSSTVTGTLGLLRSLDSLITGTSTVGAELNRLAGLTVVIGGVATISAELFGAAADVRGFVFPENEAQAHTVVDNVAQYHASVADEF